MLRWRGKTKLIYVSILSLRARPEQKTKYNNPTHVSFETSEMAGLEQGLWQQLTQARVFLQQKFVAPRTICNTLSLSQRGLALQPEVKKAEKQGNRIQPQRQQKRFSGGHRAVQVKRYHPPVKNVNSSC